MKIHSLEKVEYFWINVEVFLIILTKMIKPDFNNVFEDVDNACNWL